MKHFKDYQLHALRESSRLTFLLVVAILATILLSGAAATYAVTVQAYFEQVAVKSPSYFYGLVFLICTVASAGIVATGTVWKLLQLRAGGGVIAEQLGGELLQQPRDLDDQRLINIVEEMALASNCPVPAIYILEGEQSINAFAAGYSQKDAVIGITRGAIRHLNRDQLQGVVAHEFSHILNGDMRLNMHMLAWLHGVLTITLTAEWLIVDGYNSVFDDRDGYRSQRYRLGNCLLGLCLWPVGVIGWFASLLVKAAMNRQREYLADAFAVQFTRYPGALADALKRLMSHDAGSRVRSAYATEVSHMFLVEGSGWLNGLFASHPPLHDRIKRLDPDWDGLPEFAGEDQVNTFAGAFEGAANLLSSSKVHVNSDESRPSVVGNINSLRETTLSGDRFFEETLASLPQPVIALLEANGGPTLVIEALLQVKTFDGSGKSQSMSGNDHLDALVEYFRTLSDSQHLVLFDALVDQLKRDSRGRETVLKTLDQWQPVVARGNLFAWMADDAIRAVCHPQPAARPRYGKLQDVLSAYAVILSWLSHAGGSLLMAGYSFQRGLASTGLNLELIEQEHLSWSLFLEAVEMCQLLAPQPKHDLMVSIAAAISSDRRISNEEALLLRTLCSKLGGSIPTLLPGQEVAFA